MRERKWRAIEIKTKKFLYSEIVGRVIFWSMWFQGELDSNTVGDFIGVKDKKGEDIYECDILRDEDGMLFEVMFGELPLNKSGDCVCTYPAFYAKGYGKLGRAPDYECEEIGNYHECIGNIYENPELLKGGK